MHDPIPEKKDRDWIVAQILGEAPQDARAEVDASHARLKICGQGDGSMRARIMRSG